MREAVGLRRCVDELVGMPHCGYMMKSVQDDEDDLEYQNDYL
jgi:hypothetical protein